MFSLIIVWAIITYLLIPFYKHYFKVKESEKKRIRKNLEVKKNNKNNESESEWYEF